VDLNGDGRKDLLTARSNAKKGEGELLWLEHPEAGLDSTEPWTEHSLGNLADVTFSVETMEEYPDEIVMFSAHFFDEAVRMIRISTKDGSLVGSKTIDDANVLSAYTATLVDLNGDGSRQLLVNDHQTKDKETAVWAYQFPEDPMNDDWTRVTLASGFHNAFSLTAPGMSPGFTYAFYPQGKKDGEKAHIMVAGDGDHAAHAMYPTDEDFGYENTIFKQTKGTVGSLVFSDLDEDGWQEVWLPVHDEGTITLYKLSTPASTPEEFLQ